MKDFTKSDLRTGQIVTTRNGHHYLVLLGAMMSNINEPTDMILNLNRYSWNPLYHYNNDLMHLTYDSSRNWSEDDIIKVEQPANPVQIWTVCYENMRRETLWRRNDPKEMTIAEIEAALGHPVKIVKEK